MKTSGFLRDIDDEHLYAEALEKIWMALAAELSGVLAKFPLIVDGGPRDGLNSTAHPLIADFDEIYTELSTMRHTMTLVARDMAERNRRLADSAVRLPDRVLDEQSRKRHLGSRGERRD